MLRKLESFREAFKATQRKKKKLMDNTKEEYNNFQRQHIGKK
jgi:hypothetical protein